MPGLWVSKGLKAKNNWTFKVHLYVRVCVCVVYAVYVCEYRIINVCVCVVYGVYVCECRIFIVCVYCVCVCLCVCAVF